MLISSKRPNPFSTFFTAFCVLTSLISSPLSPPPTTTRSPSRSTNHLPWSLSASPLNDLTLFAPERAKRAKEGERKACGWALLKNEGNTDSSRSEPAARSSLSDPRGATRCTPPRRTQQVHTVPPASGPHSATIWVFSELLLWVDITTQVTQAKKG